MPRHRLPATALLTIIVVAAACGTGEDDVPADAGSAPGASDPTEVPETEHPETDTEDDDAIPVIVEAVAEGLDFPNRLVDLGDGRLLIGDQRGAIRVLDNGVLRDEPFLDLTDRVLPPDSRGGQELGLSGFAVHPEFADNGTLYVLFTEPDPDHPRADVLAEFQATGPEFDVVDPSTERELIRLEQRGTTHIGGRMDFGDDGLLYVGLGDAGRSEHPQDPETLQGSVIRIDVAGDPYSIPADNPFVDGGGAPEVYAYGFRNPFRGSWDPDAGFVVADPKWTAKDQEVHVVVSGGNVGYPVMPPQLPASSCYESETSTTPLPECLTGPDGEAFVPPAVEYRGEISIGAARYLGDAIPALQGMLVVADWRGELMAAAPDLAEQRWLTTPLAVRSADDEQWSGGRYVWSLERDDEGEIYVMVIPRSFSEGNGVVYRLAPAEPG